MTDSSEKVEEKKEEKVESKNEENAGKATCCAVGKKPCMTKAAILILAVAILGSAYYYSVNKKGTVTEKDIKAKFESLIEGDGGTTTVKEVVLEGGLYKVVISANGQDQSIYATKDGTKFFPQAVDFAEVEKQKEEALKQAEAEKNLPKTDKPVVDLYVMSFCPYGNKAEDTMKPVYDLLKNKVEFNFRYIVSVSGSDVQSLHGAKEVTQNEREACVLKDYGKDKWFGFVSYVNKNCGSDGACWEAGAKSLGISTVKVNACVASDGLALMKADDEASKKAGASGSPTLKINGINSKVAYQYGNPEAYKQTICSAFTVAPEECSKVLAGQATAAAAASAGGSCN